MNNELLQMNEECDITGNTLDKNAKMLSQGIINEKVSGIYKIINKINGKYYVGSSENILGKRGRWFWHRHFLNKNKHPNIHLQNAWNKYGKNVWEWVIIETTDILHLSSTEQKHLDICKKNPHISYNLSYDVERPSLGYKHTTETKEKIRIRMMGSNNPMYGLSPTTETRLKISGANKGKNRGNKHYNFGKHLSKEHRMKISLGGIGMKRSEETKRHISESLKGRIFSEEHKQKLRAARLKVLNRPTTSD